MAVPLGLVARLEELPRDRVEQSSGSPVTQYRGRLMPLVSWSDAMPTEREHQPVLVFTDRHCSMGLMVDEIVDVVEERLEIELSGARPGVLGTAVIGGHATDVIDTAFWLMQADPNWFGIGETDPARERKRVLVVDDSDFFRELLLPILAADGFAAEGVASAGEALRLRDQGRVFDALISNIAMPEMDGNALARTLRAGGAWSELPLIALSASVEPCDIERSRAAGFSDYVPKFNRTALLASLRQCLSQPASA
jgi:two-component system chemotaxis sensor kinase CheA